MCGICGVVTDGNGSPTRSTLEAMSAALGHRGPDGDGLLIDGAAGLAMRRLAIIDPEHGQQPMQNEDGSVSVICNGEIYNHAELRDGLRRRGHQLDTTSDTEVLAHLYEESGPGFVEQLRGMFAIALWDARERRLVLARDRFGIKPLFHSVVGGELRFASELKGLFAAEGTRGPIDLDALESYWARGFVGGDRTIYRDARKLRAGHLLIWENGYSRIREFARPRPAFREELRGEPFGVLAAELRERLRDSVRAHLTADVPVGVLLSGGVDSSIITALAAEEYDGRLTTFSAGFDEPSFDERSRARLVAERYGTEHRELRVGPDDVRHLPEILAGFDEPFADPSAVPTYLVSALAAKHVKVVLAGEGGDELFGGYSTYVADAIAPVAGRVASAALPLLERVPSTSHALRLDDKAKRFARGGHLPKLERHVSWQEVFSAEAREELVLEHRGGDPLEAYRVRWAETAGVMGIARYQDLDLGVYLVDQILAKTDRCSMANSLEVRVPFLDTAVSDFALSVPSHHHVRAFAKKRLLRAAAAPLVPDEILRAPKQGFTIPTAGWLRGPLRALVRDRLAPSEIARDGYLDESAVTRLVDDHLARRNDNSRQIWALLAFKLWLDGRVA